MNRPVISVGSPLHTSVGPLRVAQPLPTHDIDYLDPFVLLHHAGPQAVVAGADEHRIDPHPHRGFAPVTFVYDGAVLHRDSLGNESIVRAEGVQWINAAKGIVHSEGPAAELRRDGGNLELIQLWVNVPRATKMIEPSYQELTPDRIPLVEHSGVRLRVVSGSACGVVGPAVTQSPVTSVMAWLEPGASVQWNVADPTAAVYILGGTVLIGGRAITTGYLAVLGEGSQVTIEATETSRLLLLSGQPLNEPVATGGPFVMNTKQEVYQAFMDYQNGHMGVLTS
jgi:redox-sensitive bicupin YhaK (pirin superfamily)